MSRFFMVQCVLKLCQKLDRRPNSYNLLRHFVHPPHQPNFYRGTKSTNFCFDFRHQSLLTYKKRRISEI